MIASMAVGRCAECGFDPAGLRPGSVGDEVGRWVAECARLVAGAADGALRAPAAGLAWSPLDYVGHLRDVLALFAARVRLVLTADGPELPVVDHDEAVRAGAYRGADPRDLTDDLLGRANELRAVLAAVRGPEWDRIGYRAGQERSVLEIAQRAAHEARHHTGDVARSLRESAC